MSLHVIGVRHHSPACARLVEATIRRLKPSMVLVEGPCDMNDRLGELTLEHHLPVALFTYRQGPDGRTRRSWCPFCEYSPEWIALREAAAVGARARFIDLPAWDPAFDEERSENRYSDRHLRESARMQELCRRLGFEDIDSLWDHLFEQPMDLQQMEHKLDRYFTELRADEVAEPRDLAREQFMIRHVAWALDQAGDRDVVVVCGGYHKPAIEKGIEVAVGSVGEPPVVEPPEGCRIGTYLVPFSFERLSSFDGYASGMPSPGFHQRVWEEGAAAPEAMLFEAIHHLRRRKLRVSPADAIAAATMAHGLRAMRGHAALARVDVLDGLAAALVKDALETPLPWTRRGTLSPRTDPMLVEMVAAFTGTRHGRLHTSTPRPPLMADVFSELDRVRLTLTRAGTAVRVPLRTEEDRARSAVLHRLRVLGIPGFTLRRGPSFVRRHTDLTEEWSLGMEDGTEPALIEAALHGATLEAAAGSRIEDRLRKGGDVGSLAQALESAALARLPELAGRALTDIDQIVRKEASFAAIGRALIRLVALRRGELVLGSEGAAQLDRILASCFDRGLWLFEGLVGPDLPLDEDHIETVIALRETMRIGEAGAAERARALCARRVRDAAAPPALRGAALGLLWSGHPEGTAPEELARDPGQILRGMARPATFGDFLGGLFALAREEVPRAPALIRAVDAVVAGFMREDFLVALPSLRQAFMYFPPRERATIAREVVAVSDEATTTARDLLETVDPGAFARGAMLEDEADRLAARFGLGGGP